MDVIICPECCNITVASKHPHGNRKWICGLCGEAFDRPDIVRATLKEE